MPEPHFLSYSKADGRAFAERLHAALTAPPDPAPLWFDAADMRPGSDWDDQIVAALRACRGVLFAMTPDSVTSQSVCKREWSRALAYKKPVIPLLVHPGVEVPFRLEGRQYVDFTGDFGHEIGRLDITVNDAGLIVRIDADLE